MWAPSRGAARAMFCIGKMLLTLALVLPVALAADIDSCNPDKMTVYRMVLHTYWTREKFPKHYPDWRPPAQWSKVYGNHGRERQQVENAGLFGIYDSYFAVAPYFPKHGEFNGAACSSSDLFRRSCETEAMAEHREYLLHSPVKLALHLNCHFGARVTFRN
ncbi:hypothetical protein EVAR_48321_1 [Eumeta japonica]|uniref:Spondin domain-containing protein n=1 Tax=Eumeta variegata TaxID=151549 RepID=A0A4C1WJV3_EUMVA|nr:hypothetical protein EVAR_48321_1 [Eumeta japonica]